MSSSSSSKKPSTNSTAETTTTTSDEDPFISFQELIGDALNSSTVAATKMIQVMAEVFTQQQQILNLQIENQEILKENQELLKNLHSSQKLLIQESKHQIIKFQEDTLEAPMETEIPTAKIESPKRSETPSLKRRRERSRPAPNKRKFQNSALYSQLSVLLEALIEYKDSEGRQVSADFIYLPSKREMPDYYKLVSHPMDFSRLRRNLKHGHYDTIDALGNDIKLLCLNCQTFNREDSDIFRDSETLLAIWERLKASATALI